MADYWLTFDCYGTLVDWESGIAGLLGQLWPDQDPSSLLEVYHRIEPEVQAGSHAPYRDVMAQTMAGLAAELDLTISAGDDYALAESLPAWPIFEEAPIALETLRNQGFGIAILSNTDQDLISSSMKAIGFIPDKIVTAAEAGSYKPALGHWNCFFESVPGSRDHHFHVAASLFFDVVPCVEMGLACVWINRSGETTELRVAAELTDLKLLPEVIAGLTG